MERKYVWWHHGRAFAAGVAALTLGAVGACGVLVATRASLVGAVLACVVAVAPLPWTFALDRRITNARRARARALGSTQP